MKIEGVYLVAGLRYHKTFDEFLQAVEAALKAGVKIFQLRVKNDLEDKDHIYLARRTRELTAKYESLFIVDDRPDIALLSDADGIHLGPNDMYLHDARKILGNDKIIGMSSHTEEQVKEAINCGISYLSVGPVYETDCKKNPDPVVGTKLLQYAIDHTRIPIVAIGGIGLECIKDVMQIGVKSIGVIRGIMQTENIYEASKNYIEEVQKYL
ncbi:thiamine phosphate synthase [bacterium]